MTDMNLIIRHETEQEYRLVEELTREAFWNVHVPGCHEHFVLHNLRNHRDFLPALDFVAERDGRIVGNIVYSRGTIKDQQGTEKAVIGFGPVSVLPALQKQGIGTALINHSLGAARAMGYQAVCIYGDPRYYHRCGFWCAEKFDVKTADDKYAAALLALELAPGALSNSAGRFVESSAFAVDEQQFAEYDATFAFREKSEMDSQREFRLLASLMY
jgi:putative acetyltransferase